MNQLSRKMNHWIDEEKKDTQKEVDWQIVLETLLESVVVKDTGHGTRSGE